VVVRANLQGWLVVILKGFFISLTELTEYTEKDNYYISFAAEATANENRYA
jgi:hypothetical protein